MYKLKKGGFHIATVNQLGLRRKFLAIDKTFDAEIWSQPVYKYRLEFFNPVTKKVFPSAKKAMMMRSLIKNDKYKKYRGQKAKFLVGVRAWVTYSDETKARPDHKKIITPSDDAKYNTTAKYTYDLEIDEKGNIVGGEWHTKVFPDYMIVKDPNSEPYSHYDDYLKGKSIQERLEGAHKVAHKFSKETSAPLSGILEKLIELSR